MTTVRSSHFLDSKLKFFSAIAHARFILMAGEDRINAVLDQQLIPATNKQTGPSSSCSSKRGARRNLLQIITGSALYVIVQVSALIKIESSPNMSCNCNNYITVHGTALHYCHGFSSSRPVH